MFNAEADYASILAVDWTSLPRREQEIGRLMAVSKAGVSERLLRASARRDRIELIAIGRVLDRFGKLAGKNRLRFAAALISVEAYAEALLALAEPKLLSVDRGSALGMRARALAACGQFEEALASVREGLTLTPTSREFAALNDALAEAKHLSAGAGASWADAKTYLGALLDLSARKPAADFLKTLFGSPPPWDALPDFTIEIAECALGLLNPAEVSGLVTALVERFPYSDAVKAVHLRWSVRMGKETPLVTGIPQANGRQLQLAIAEALEAAEDLPAAITSLGDLALQYEQDLQVRTALSYSIGRLVNATSAAGFGTPRAPRTFNLFPFYNEITILQIRLREMADWVDHFVIVEAAETFTGRAKPFYLDDFKAVIAEFEPKILRVKVDAFPACCRTPWAREFYQRDVAVRALDGLWTPDDLMIVTDVDEIVDRRGLEGFDSALAALRMRTHRFFLNYCAKEGTTHANRRSGFACKAEVLSRFGSSYLRMSMAPYAKDWLSLPNCGWHLTSIGDAEAIADKFRSFSHQEEDKATFRDVDRTRARLNSIRAGSTNPVWERREIDDSFPAYVREHEEELGALIL